MQIILFICNVTQKNSAMSKSKDAKKEVKKEATKTIKEKRAAKKDKKPKYDWYFTIREISDKIKKGWHQKNLQERYLYGWVN